MTPRPRKNSAKDLPANLYKNKIKGKVYYRYKRPDNGSVISFGDDKNEAVAAAIQLNQMLTLQNDLIGKVIAEKNQLGEYIANYIANVLPNKTVKGFPLSSKTIEEQTRILKHVNNEIGHLSIERVTQKDLAKYLNAQSTAEVHNKHRSVIATLYKQIISDGIVQANIAENILKKDIGLTKRQRLSLDQYKAIYAHAAPEIRNAMELSLNSIQRREDIKSWRFDCEKDGFYYIVQSKTRKHGKASYIRIPVTLPVAFSMTKAKTLKDIIRNCRDELACPFVIHKKPERKRESKEKEHSMQLSGKQISDGFADARELAGIKMEYPPTFHELISLGEAIRFEQGWTEGDLQVLRGHTNKETTRKYLDGQVWTTVEVPNFGG